MKSMPKVKSLADLKSLINDYQGALSEGNVRIINEIIREIEKSGGVNNDNRARLKTLMKHLAQKNNVNIPKK
jgi:predicted nuclease with TOPRIM domain